MSRKTREAVSVARIEEMFNELLELQFRKGYNSCRNELSIKAEEIINKQAEKLKTTIVDEKRKSYNEGYADAYRIYQIEQFASRMAEKKPGWHTGKPRENDSYLVTIHGAMRTSMLDYEDGEWTDEAGETYKVDAWMKRPEVYKED